MFKWENPTAISTLVFVKNIQLYFDEKYDYDDGEKNKKNLKKIYTGSLA